jgi:hypothetical protein
MKEAQFKWDAFISYAREDTSFVQHLAARLELLGLTIWYDKLQLELGDSLRKSIDEGLSHSRFGIVIVSHSFLCKKWPLSELSALTAREYNGQKVILPIWHGVTNMDIIAEAPLLADRIAVSSADGFEAVLHELLKVLRPKENTPRFFQDFEFDWPDGSRMILLPVCPFQGHPYSPGALCLSRYPVTNAQYSQFLHDARGWNWNPPLCAPSGKKLVLTSHGQKWDGPFYPLEDESFKHPAQPVVCVSLRDAERYCWGVNFIGQSDKFHLGTMLPTTNMWDLAAFGSIAPARTSHSWLSQSTTIHHCSAAPARVDRDLAAPNASGFVDTIGNVWEWCSSSVKCHPSLLAGANISTVKAELRGGGFYDNLEYISPFLDANLLPEADKTKHCDLGFRIAGRVRLDALPKEVKRALLSCPLELKDVVQASAMELREIGG